MSSPYNVSYSSYSVPMASSQYSSSPMECDETMSNASGVPSGYSATSAGYMRSSTGDYDSTHSASGVDFQEYMQERFSNSFNPIPLDRSMAVQAQTSGKLNAKHRELMELQQQAQARLARTRERFQEGMRDAREVRGDLEWTQKKVTSLQNKASRKHPKEYAKARARYPSPEC
ncbi:Biogenesis of lysosome-related organelles complex 1 subunit-like protein [Hapsidospora chrysogenum ATCC 11550]|uniref:Biogenesis of lysosome-related organelles complex 1 subunit KXD1 n=1 Tax=Hapsidospora chrysogenum (strain ATCC 11550 / CBS 779.69 / DSM 880 / IAM 14645 / JCM 23072 / IMI 49137) TaxID=857340 RepID=A0A086SZ46_HAPC1|nr:Biogenesis of lysosome-related organelles complex 1 subunit-like protein [Hapsidospora chrysogenum ATCC 11550]